jgi:uncharacterized protein
MEKKMTGKICGTGSWVPDKVWDNNDLARMVETSDAWIRERTGVVQRHIAKENEDTVTMAARAAQKALGIILNTKSGLGVSPIISVAYSIATIGGFNFGNITFLLYSAFVVVEIVLHIFRNHRYSGEAGGAIAPAAHRDLKLVLVMDLLQLPLSLVFTRFMNLFSALLPTPSDNMPSRLLVLAAGIILTGIGAAMSLNMRIIPNPGDGIVQAISDCIGKSVGFTKNCFDLFNICLTTSIGLLFAHKLIGIGLGTVIAVLGVGRVIAVFNRLFMKKMTAAAGVEY